MRHRSAKSEIAFVLLAAVLTMSKLAFAQTPDDDSLEQAEFATAVVRNLHEGLVRMSSSGDLDSRFAFIEPLIRSTHNLEYIAQLTIRRQWRNLSDEDRARFVSLFERLSVMNYASRFSGLSAESFRLDGVGKAAGGRLQIDAAILPANGEPVPLAYTMQSFDGEWRIVNIFADGVSDLALKRAEYQGILTDGSIEDLIEYVDAQIRAFR